MFYLRPDPTENLEFKWSEWTLTSYYHFQILPSKYHSGSDIKNAKEDSDAIQKSGLLKNRNYDLIIINKILKDELTNDPTNSIIKKMQDLDNIHMKNRDFRMNLNEKLNTNQKHQGKLKFEFHDLIARNWKIMDSCHQGDCVEKFWSTEFPDIKSTLDEFETIL